MGRAKGPAPTPAQVEPPPEEEEAHPDQFLEVELQSYDAPVDTASVSSDTTKKKRVRESKKEIPEYKWTDETTIALAEYIKEHHCLYDKRAKLWLNLQAKNALWEEIGLQLDPPASGKYNK